MRKSARVALFDVLEIDRSVSGGCFLSPQSTPLLEEGFESRSRSKCDMDQRFVIPNHHDHGADSTGDGFLYGVLDQRFTRDGSISLGRALVAGSILVPKPAAGITAVAIFGRSDIAGPS